MSKTELKNWVVTKRWLSKSQWYKTSNTKKRQLLQKVDSYKMLQYVG